MARMDIGMGLNVSYLSNKWVAINHILSEFDCMISNVMGLFRRHIFFLYIYIHFLYLLLSFCENSEAK